MLGRKDKPPLEEVKNLLEPLVRITDTHHQRTQSVPEAKPKLAFPGPETPVNRNIARPPANYEASAMKGIIFTATGETLATPTPAELTNLFVNTPKVGLNFAKIFDFEEGDREGEELDHGEEDSIMEGPPPSPSIRDRAKSESKSTHQRESANASAPPTPLRRPSIRCSVQRPVLPASTSDPTGLFSQIPPSKTSKRSSSSAAAATSAPKRLVVVLHPSPPRVRLLRRREPTQPIPQAHRKGEGHITWRTRSYA
jgi:NIMA (never in mitosis gene a)-related kinase